MLASKQDREVLSPKGLSLKYFQNGEALAVFSYLVKFSRIAQSSTSRQHIKTVGCTFYEGLRRAFQNIGILENGFKIVQNIQVIIIET